MRNKEDWEILYTLATNEGLRKKDVRYEQAYDNIVNLFYEKDKIIDLMAEFIATLDIEEDICANIENDNCDKMAFGECENCIKQYFADKVEKE